MAINTARARELVSRIATDHGHLGEEVYQRMDPETRRKVEEAFLKKDLMIGSSVITLAKNLYTKEVRFIFELLQNADDNQFTHAKAQGKDAYVVFRVYRDRIVVECNEDGFTEANLRAICNVGKSSKLGAQGYIGEKGIGFKSVFKVAWKVWIQSGSFSFGFKHRPGDSGMGMISPEWQSTDEVLPSALTRMTFYLHDEGDPDARAEQQRNIETQLRDLRPEMLLFLKNLKVVEVHLHDNNGKELTSSTLSCSTLHNGQITLHTTRAENGSTQRTDQHYFVSRSEATRLPPSENREYSAEEHETAAFAKAEIVLAFPLSKKSTPVIAPQQIYAFLPIRHVGLNFLIHTDFVTVANREDIVVESPRNKKLRSALSSALISAMTRMCGKSDKLRFQWMQYLPDQKRPLTEPFWKTFTDEVRETLADNPLLVDRVSSRMHTLKQLRRLTPDMLDESGAPLLEDLHRPQNVYPASDYTADNLSLLTHYGLGKMSMEDVIIRIAADLERPLSKMRNPNIGHDWHSRVANLLIKMQAASVPMRTLKDHFRGVSILPLSDGSWTKPDNNDVYFPTTTDGLEIPSGLGLKLIDLEAAAHQGRYRLFQALGVTVIDSEAVRGMILETLSSTRARLLDRSASFGFLHFLYRTHPADTHITPYKAICLFKSTTGHCIPSQEDVYFPDDNGKYSPAKLGVPGVTYIHSYYLDRPQLPSGRGGDSRKMTWRQWLRECIGIRQHLRLATPSGKSCSPEVAHVAASMPEKFLGLLQSIWQEGDHKSEELLDELRETQVICEGGQKVALKNAILPLPPLKQICARYTDNIDGVPFLKLESAVTDGDTKWQFLDDLFVLREDELQLYLNILDVVAEVASKEVRPASICDLYASIQKSFESSFDPHGDEDIIRDFFETSKVLFVPVSEGCFWSTLDEDFLTGGPSDMKGKYSIDSIYAERYGRTGVADMQALSVFFRDTLEIPPYTWRDILGEVRHIRYKQEELDSDHVQHIRVQYERLRDEWPKLSDAEVVELRSTSQSEELVLASVANEDEGWYKAANCIWSPTTKGVRGKPNLATQYDETLENFFVNQLGVQRLSLLMVIDDLAAAHRSGATVDDVKGQLYTLNELLRTAERPEEATLQRLLASRIFPVRYPTGEVELRDAGTEFVIVDRQQLGRLFRDKVKTLDFSMSEVHAMDQLIRGTRLEHRFLSRKVAENATLQSGIDFPLSEARYDISAKAHALTRIAATFRSPRFEAGPGDLYDLLRRSQTRETDGISSTLSLHMDGRKTAVHLEESEVYINDSSGSNLKFYIPHDEASLDVCIQHALPLKLAQWLMTDPDSDVDSVSNTGTVRVGDDVVAAMTALINAKLASVSRVLEKLGIIDIDLPNDDSNIASEPPLVNAPAPNSDLNTLPPTLVGPSTPTQAGAPAPATPESAVSSSASTVGIFTPPARTDTSPFRFNFTASPAPEISFDYFTQLSDPAGGDLEHYIQVLSHVICAGRTICFPSANAQLDSPNRRGHLSPLDHATQTRFWDASTPGARDFKVGAAGELFVFTLLCSLRFPEPLPSFTVGNWTSSIRRLAQAHPDYAEMAPWDGREEISDLQYQDATGCLTELLVREGHLRDADRWGGRRDIEYFFEVKSTAGGWDVPFYMSGTQYEKMRQCTRENSVYIIFRVYHLLSDMIDVKLYVDPLELQRQGKLTFKTDGKFTVTAKS
ncbi:hypothetical protein B0T14DRAFT_487161 [Immersiella caudata]|uniref:Protein NO VEIN C-terminal domain-containing protein n=1 Tax=Immersiella caudata TaxID=314043 RepID=A0AA39W9X2_9PEZI|nr:hypothetical protein B0T14DRAFT_487161 [Immersiella caudata]